jgi:zinc and cadmium transporter
MTILGYIVVFTILGSLVSLIGGVLLLLNERLALKASHVLASFAAGALLATAFFDLLPEAQESAEGAGINIFLWTLLGLLTFFLLERFIDHFHHHHTHEGDAKKKSLITLITVGDGVHNFIDGVAIAATFLVSIPLGIATSLAVAAHEIPQEIGDFGVMLHHGVKRGKVLLFNILSALTALVGAILTYLAADKIQGLLPIFLSITAGFFIYIAASDLIPEIHSQEKKSVALIETFALLLGVLVVWFFITLLEGSH